MVCVLVTSGWLPAEDVGVHLLSAPRFPPVSALVDGRLLMKLPLLTHQLPRPN